MKDHKLLIGSVVLVFTALLVAWFMVEGERERQRQLEEIASQQVDTETSVIEDQSRGERTVTLFFYRPGKLAVTDDFFESDDALFFAPFFFSVSAGMS